MTCADLTLRQLAYAALMCVVVLILFDTLDDFADVKTHSMSEQVARQAFASRSHETTREATNKDAHRMVDFAMKLRKVKRASPLAGVPAPTPTTFKAKRALPLAGVPAPTPKTFKATAHACEGIKETRYWKDVAADKNWVSPYDSVGPKEKYVSFEPDKGGWNNIRMGMETVLLFAHATGRTLVIPPEQPWYLLDKSSSKWKHGFGDFFDLDAMHAVGVKTISMSDFLQKEVASGHLQPEAPSSLLDLLRKETTENCDRSCNSRYLATLWPYLRQASARPRWDPNKHFLALPNAVGGNYKGAEDRLSPFKLRGREMKEYTKELQDATLVHVPTEFSTGERLLTHFYAFLFVADLALDRHLKRVARDALHYRSDIFCKAGEIVRLLKEEGGGSFSSFHIRRGDFQFELAKIPIQEIFDNTKDLYKDKELVYISTDHKNRAEFEPLRKRYTLKFLSDFEDKVNLKDLNPNYMGMVEQIVASNGRIFTGTWWSTFTGYIMRMRGYKGLETQSYYFLKEYKQEMQRFQSPEGPGWWREWPTAWKDIDG